MKYFNRAICEDTEYPANVVPDKNSCTISHNGLEYRKYEYYVLCGNCFSWKGSFEGSLPYNAVNTGHTKDNKPIYVARTKHNKNWILGKVS